MADTRNMTLLVYKGPTSQTGRATAVRYPNLRITMNKDEFEDIGHKVAKGRAFAILPVWNSHEGEIRKANVVALVFREEARIADLWPARIRFSMAARKPKTWDGVRDIASVSVAQNQCSEFLLAKGRKIKHTYSSTVDAVDAFKQGKHDALICAPWQVDPDIATVLEDDVSNCLNFTDFILIGNGLDRFLEDAGNKPLVHIRDAKVTLFGVEMAIPGLAMSDGQKELLDQIMGESESIDRMPRAVFVVRREGGKCAVIWEYDSRDEKYSPPETILSEEPVHGGSITVKSNLGMMCESYSRGLFPFLRKEFPRERLRDFTLHRGSASCMYACPPLDIAIHGYESPVVEPIFRKIVARVFFLLENGINRTRAQQRFFQKYRKKFNRLGERFIPITEIKAV